MRISRRNEVGTLWVSPKRPRPLPASGKLLHEHSELRAVHWDGLRKVRLQNGTVLTEPVIARLPRFFLVAIFLKDLPVLFLYGFQLILILRHVRQQSINIQHFCLL